MEDTLGELDKTGQEASILVLILVLMEDTLGVKAGVRVLNHNISLNPCSNGRYSRRKEINSFGGLREVLILVLMEDTLGG